MENKISDLEIIRDVQDQERAGLLVSTARTTRLCAVSTPLSQIPDGTVGIPQQDSQVPEERNRIAHLQTHSAGTAKSSSHSPLEHSTRGPGRPRKIIPPNRDWPTRQLEYSASLWYLVSPDRNDESEFERLLVEQRKLYASEGFNTQVALYENDLARRELELRHWPFTPENLLRLADSRPPLTHNGTLTASGAAKARILLVRERLIAGTVEIGRTPDLSKLRDYLGPLLSELMTDRA
jgi:hypothetical protein